MRALLSQIRFQAIVVALVPVAVLAAILSYTLGTRNATSATVFWADHTLGVSVANDALMTAFNDEIRTRGTVGFPGAVLDVGRRSAMLLAIANTTPAERRQAQAYVDAVNAATRLLARSPPSPALLTKLTIAKRNVDRSERIIAIDALRQTSDHLARFSEVLLWTLVGGVVLFLSLGAAFGAHVWLRARLLGINAQQLRAGKDPDPLGGDDELSVAEREYRGVLEQLQQEHKNVTLLQRALLPQNLPQIPGVRIDASYMPSASDADVGGDWYDVFTVGEGRLGISVGDVAGHGLQAASTMAQMRQSMRMAARLYDQPADVLQAVNRVVCDESSALVTIFYGELSLTSGLFVYASAGHPLPITVQATGVVEQISGGGLIMGADRRTEYRQYSMALDAGSAVVLFTDGLVESGRLAYDYDAGVRRLIYVVNREYYSATENIAQAILRGALEGRPQLDDAAVLFIALTDIGFARTSTTKTWTVDARSASAARRAKRAFLWHLGEFASDGTDLSTSELIFGELVGNVARHTPGHAEITLELVGDNALLHVLDDGPPIVHAVARPEDLAEGGRGLLLVKSLARALTIGRTIGGNQVTAELPITLSRREIGPRAPARIERLRMTGA
ncbi:MAG TPA: SpoIIE family protein phosphatase [Candidatus Acidoferrum sp.]|nr:SpoIIE family protein phosphatase [Candidatus Acidoferrum sp.]